MECGKDRTGRDTFDSVGVWVSVWMVRRGVEGRARTTLKSRLEFLFDPRYETGGNSFLLCTL